MAHYTGRHRLLPARPLRKLPATAGAARHRLVAPVVVLASVAGAGVGALGLATAVNAGQVVPRAAASVLASRTKTNVQAAVVLTATRAQQRVSRDMTRGVVGADLAQRTKTTRARVRLVAAKMVAAEKTKAVAAERARAATEKRRRTAAIADVQSDPRAAARALMAGHGWKSDSEYSCLVNLWEGESNWTWSARNPSSGAYGIPQSLPASKMAQFGDDYRTNPVTQMKWGLSYIDGRYGSPCSAWTTWQSRSPHWY